MTYDLWNYVDANPINFTDATGNWPCALDVFNLGWSDQAIKSRVDTAEKYVQKTSQFMDTYTAAGIAVQCAGTNWNKDWYNSGSGIAQISLNQANTDWGKPIYDLDWFGNKKPVINPETGKQATDSNGDLLWKIRSYGLRCPVDGQKPLDPNNNDDAVILMKREIQLVTTSCINCTNTDIYIAASLAQNGPGFSYKDMQSLPILRPPENRTKYHINRNWFDRFNSDLKNNSGINTKTQLDHFTLVIYELKSRGWYVPEEQFDFSWNTVEMLRKWQLNQVY